MNNLRFFTLLAALSLALALPLSTRVATYPDIPGTYASVFKFQSDCPDIVILPESTVDARQIALVPVSSIVEDGVPCSGAENMLMVSEATVKKPGLLDALQLPEFREALFETNPNANATVMNSKNTSSLLVGFDGEQRVCGTNVYPANTIYFIIKEATGFKIAFDNSDGSNLISIPSNVKALFITTSSSKLCLLTDATTSVEDLPTLTTVAEDGNSATVTLAPSSMAPPATPTPVASAPEPTATPVVVIETPIAVTETPAPVVEESQSPPTTVDEGGAFATVEPVLTGLPAAPDASPDTDSVITAVPVPTDNGTSSASGDTDDGSACFPASAMVTLSNGVRKSMAELQIGDVVMTPSGPSDVILFTHRESDSLNQFVRLTTVSGSLTVSAGHYVLSEGALRAAADLGVEERLDVEDRSEVIISIEHVSARGLYNPQTVSGDIYVNGFATSTYTTAIHPQLAHCMLQPVRWLYAMSVERTRALGNVFNHGSRRIARMLPSGPGRID